MKCERCGGEASINIRSISGGVSEEHWLCPQCAAQVGLHAGPFSISISLKDLLPSLASSTCGEEELTCPSCGLTWSRFAKTGLLGCGGCYDAFARRLTHIIRRVQAGEFHRGRRPAEDRQEVERLKEELRRALEEEAYERAAVIRDRIREIEGGDRDACR